MSNFRAIATVTSAISQILSEVDSDVAGTVVNMKPPDAIGKVASDSLNLFLYQVTPNVGYRNSDVPTRNREGELISKPQLALNLHYLLTAYSAENDELRAQQILASAMRILHENPVLTRDKIRKAIQNEAKIAGSDLADQVEIIKLSPKPLSIEEIAKLWSSFFQTNYRISVAYEATVVLLESKQEPKPTLPVRERQLYVVPFRQPLIDRVDPQILERTANAELTIIGRNLKADKASVQFDSLDVIELQPEDFKDNQVSVAVPDKLTAGVKSVQILHPLMLGVPETEHRGYESNVASFVLAPKITQLNPNPVPVGDTLSIEFEPAVVPKQKVAILIGDYVFPLPPREPKSEPVKKLSIKIPEDFPVGESLLRLRVDGAHSLLEADNDTRSQSYGQFVGPKIIVSRP